MTYCWEEALEGGDEVETSAERHQARLKAELAGSRFTRCEPE